MKKKGFTLVELLVVIAIIALLMGILMPALARVRQIAYRLYCGTNLSGIGKAMLIYAQDYDDELPRAGGNDGVWQAVLNDWDAFNAATAYGATGNASISSCFFLLVKYSEVTPKSFLCKGDAGVSDFRVSDPAPDGAPGRDVVDLWNFGEYGQQHCSYAYHNPFKEAGGTASWALTASSDPGMAVAADPNPWQDGAEAKARTTWAAFILPPAGDRESVKAGNALPHQEDGQNVLFVDGHTNFEKESFCGVDDDNIYTIWDNVDPAVANRRKGVVVGSPATIPMHKNDSLLVTDGGGGKLRMCFPADTPVWADGKLVAITKVASGQKVGRSGSMEMLAGQQVGMLDCAAEIEWIQEHGVGVYDCYDVVFESGNSLTVVHSHDFLTVSGKWVAVENLTSDMKLQSLKGPIGITSIVKRAMPFVGNAFNLKVKGANVYYVGKDGVAAVDCSKLPKE